MENENCSIRASKLLSSLGMVSTEAVFDPETGIYGGTSMFESTSPAFGRNPAFGGNLWFKIRYQDALTWLSEHFNCNILIYQEYPDISDLWKVRILPGGPVFVNGFAIPIENTWSVVAEVAISTACSALLEELDKKEREYYKDDVIKYIEI